MTVVMQSTEDII